MFIVFDSGLGIVVWLWAIFHIALVVVSVLGVLHLTGQPLVNLEKKAEILLPIAAQALQQAAGDRCLRERIAGVALFFRVSITQPWLLL